VWVTGVDITAGTAITITAITAIAITATTLAIVTVTTVTTSVAEVSPTNHGAGRRVVAAVASAMIAVAAARRGRLVFCGSRPRYPSTSLTWRRGCGWCGTVAPRCSSSGEQL
jgi:hypothetical protein